MKNGSKKKRAWTAVQVRELKSLARKKTPARKIAKSLKRTEGATRQKAFSLGVSLELARVTNRVRVQLPRQQAPPRRCAGFYLVRDLRQC